MRRLRRRYPPALVVVGVVVAAAMAAPIGHLVLRASEAGDPLGIVASERVLDSLVRTVALAVVVTGASVVVGVGVAWLVERTDLPARRLVGAVAALPLAVPTYVAALSFRDAFGPRALLVGLPGVVGFWGSAAVLTLATYPYVLLVTRAALARLDPALEEAARSLGDATGAVVRRVLLPGLRPAIAAGGLLVLLYVVSDFGAVSILDTRTLTLAIFTEYRSSFDRAPAAVVGVLLVLVTVVAIGAERLVRGRAAVTPARAGVRPATQVALGGWRWPAVGLAVVPALLGAALPVAVLLYRARPARTAGDPIDLLVRSASTSVGLSAAAAIVAIVVAVPVALLAVRFPSIVSRAVEGLAVAGYALPGLVVGLALVFFGARYLPFLYQTLALVVVAYVVRFLPEALGAVRSSLVSIDPAMEDAARSLGRHPARVLVSITLPLLRGGALAGAGLVFLTAMKELPATLLLRPAGYDTLATRVWTGASEGFYSQAAPAGLLLVAISALGLVPLRRLTLRSADDVAVPAS